VTIEGDFPNDLLGNSVALSANASILAIGARGYNNGTGYVKVFLTYDDGGNRVQLGQTILGDNAYDDFGESLDITADGMTIICGSPGYSGEIDGPGYMKVFSLKSDSSLGTDIWKQIGQDIIGEANGDGFGFSVSISDDGKTIAVSAHGNDGINGVNSGHVKIYRLVDDGARWEQIGQDIDGEAAGDISGWSVSLSADGSTVAIGAPYNANDGVDSGQAAVYRIDGEGLSWERLGQSIYGGNANDLFGTSVKLSTDGNTLAIGAPGYWVENDRSGYIRVFSLTSGEDIDDVSTWNQIGQDIVGDAIGDEFGYSVSLSYDGKTVGVGARTAVGSNGVYSGRVSIYRIEDSKLNWIQVGDDIDGETAYDNLGWSVSLTADGNMVAIGSPRNENNGFDAGHVRVYMLE
jgi:hypothetical protein